MKSQESVWSEDRKRREGARKQKDTEEGRRVTNVSPTFDLLHYTLGKVVLI